MGAAPALAAGARGSRSCALGAGLPARTSPGPAARGAAALEQGATPGADRPLLYASKQALVGCTDALWACGTGAVALERWTELTRRDTAVCAVVSSLAVEAGCRVCRWTAAGHPSGSNYMRPLHKPPAWSRTGWPGAARLPLAAPNDINSNIARNAVHRVSGLATTVTAACTAAGPGI